MTRSHTVEVIAQDGEFVVEMPPRRNAWGIAGACLFGAPWLLGTTLVALGVILRVDPTQRGRALLALFMAFILTILISALAAMSIWYAFYTVWGSERLRIDLDTLAVRREVARIPIRFGGRRGFADRVVLVDRESRGGGSTHYRLEAHVDRSKIRFGAGLSDGAAREIEHEAQEFIALTRDRAVRARESSRPDDTVRRG